MKFSLSLVISLMTLILGLIFQKTGIIVVASVFVASVIDLFTRNWVKSGALGAATSISVVLKFMFSFIGFYAMVGVLISLFYILRWFIF